MKRIATLALAVLALSACDTAPELLGATLDTSQAASPIPCNKALRAIVQERAEQYACLAECDALALDCLDEPSPSCHACEHERAICVSACPMGPLAP
jgi:hypothetical protein